MHTEDPYPGGTGVPENYNNDKTLEEMDEMDEGGEQACNQSYKNRYPLISVTEACKLLNQVHRWMLLVIQAALFSSEGRVCLVEVLSTGPCATDRAGSGGVRLK